MAKLSGKGRNAPYDAHFIPVVPRNASLHAEGIEVNYEGLKHIGQEPVYDELVVFEAAQSNPRFLIELEGIHLMTPEQIRNRIKAMTGMDYSVDYISREVRLLNEHLLLDGIEFSKNRGGNYKKWRLPTEEFLNV